MNDTTNPKLEDLTFGPPETMVTATGTYSVSSWEPTPALAAAQRALTDDGDTFELDGNLSLRLRIEPDQDASINDYDSDGRVEWVRDNDYGPVRPSDFTGRARIINRDRFSSLWWEPYQDLTEEQILVEEPRIRELCEYGFKAVGLELWQTDSLGHEPLGIAWVHAVDAMYPELVGELAGELAYYLDERAAPETGQA